MKDITICMTYFKSLTLDNLAVALASVRQQDLSRVAKLVLVDNDTADTPESISAGVNALNFPMPVKLQSYKHGYATLTHAWSTNAAVQEVDTPFIFFTRADYVLEPSLLAKLTPVVTGKAPCFATSHGSHLPYGVEEYQKRGWQQAVADGSPFDYTAIDAGVWMLPAYAFRLVGGLDQMLTAWGHAQTEFQHRLHLRGIIFSVVPEVLFVHPWHAAPRDIVVAHAQLTANGIDVRDMWKRYHGASPYR
jgi:hypothetical protein